MLAVLPLMLEAVCIFSICAIHVPLRDKLRDGRGGNSCTVLSVQRLTASCFCLRSVLALARIVVAFWCFTGGVPFFAPCRRPLSKTRLVARAYPAISPLALALGSRVRLLPNQAVVLPNHLPKTTQRGQTLRLEAITAPNASLTHLSWCAMEL